VPYQNIYHEVGHAIDFVSGSYFSDALEAKKVYASDGSFEMGGSANNYNRNLKGYTKSKIMNPSGQIVDAKQHPDNAPCSNEWCECGNTNDESGQTWSRILSLVIFLMMYMV
jgi:hypothetical protein